MGGYHKVMANSWMDLHHLKSIDQSIGSSGTELEAIADSVGRIRLLATSVMGGYCGKRIAISTGSDGTP